MIRIIEKVLLSPRLPHQHQKLELKAQQLSKQTKQEKELKTHLNQKTFTEL